MKEAIIFLDGAYISLISKHFGGGKPLNFDIKKFGEKLAQKEGLFCKYIYYYTSPPFQSDNLNENEIKRKQGYDKFTNKLRKIGIYVREGRCQKIANEFSQKGVDTLITIDMIRNASLIKNFILVTCDTDFVPAIKDVKVKDQVKVIIYYFKDFLKNSKFSMSDHILDVCDKRILLKKEDFENLSIDKD
jgi:uncharacterized LabA/DUF88 family protein